MKIGIKIGRKNTQPMIEAERINESSPSYSRLRIEEGWRGARRLQRRGFLTVGGERGEIVSPRLRVNLVQLSAGWLVEKREGDPRICSYPSTFRDVVVTQQPRINAANHAAII